MSEQDNSFNQIADAGRKTVNTAIKAGKAAAAAGKAAGKAATGNFAGAAKDILSDPTLRAFVLTVVFLLVVFPIMCISAVPSTLFGGLEGFIQEVDSDLTSTARAEGDWIADVETDIPSYMDEHPAYSSNTVINGSYTFSLNNVLRSIFNFFNPHKIDAGEQELKMLDSNIYRVVGYENSNGISEDKSVDMLLTYCQMTISRYEKRKEQYKELLDDVYKDFTANPHPAYDPGKHDAYIVTKHFNSPQITIQDALAALAAYSVQRNTNSLYNLNSKSVMIWLGSFPTKDKNDTGYMCEGRSFETILWQGDCLPQYAYEELHAQELRAEEDSSYSVPNHADQSFAYVPASYIVDKQTGITCYTHVEEVQVPDFDEEGHITGYHIEHWFYCEITMTAQMLPLSTMENSAIGFWRGSFESGGTSVGSFSWTGRDGRQYTRQYDYQCEAIEDLQLYALQYLGQSDYSYFMTGGSGQISYGSLELLEGVDYKPASEGRQGNAAVMNAAKGYVGSHDASYFQRSAGLGYGDAWCAAFVSTIARDTGYGNAVKMFTSITQSAYGMNWYKSTGNFRARDSYLPAAGDLIFFDWSGVGRNHHVGFVYGHDGEYVYTIEGNSGNMVRCKKYPLNSKYIVGYGLPQY